MPREYRRIRAYQPSSRVIPELAEDIIRHIALVRQANVVKYAARFAAGLPLFDDAADASLLRNGEPSHQQVH